MKLMLRKFSALALLAGSIATGAVAQPGPPPGPHGAFHREEREYVQTKVLPVLRQQRQKLELELASTDQTQLATYRAKLKELAQREQVLRQAAHALPRPATPDSAAHHWLGRPAPSPEQQAARDERREIMQQVAQLAQKYQAAITRLTTEMQPQQAQWTTDLRAMLVKNHPAGPLERPAYARRPPAPDSGAHRRPPGPGFQGGQWHHLFRPSGFLLLAPAAAELPAAPAVATSLYPNPVAPTSQLQYELKKAGPVTVEVLDKKGTTLRTLVHLASQPTGPHTETIDLSDLPSGTYYYKVTTSAGTETKRFVKE